MAFENDIFISYAHADNEALSFKKDDGGWVDEFHKSLEIRLKQLLGEQPRIWRDPKLQGNDYFGDEISEQIPSMALLVSILSPRYVKSDWCAREVNEFIQASKDNLGDRIGNKSRIFKVIKTRISQEKHPDAMKDLLGYDFFKEDDKGNYFEFNKIFGEQAEIAYWSKLEDLAHDIVDILEEIKSRTDALANTPTENVENKNNKGIVYLAESSYDLNEERDKVRRELLDNGYEVLPNSNLPDHLSAEYESKVHELLLQCNFSVHLFGKFYGKTPEDSPKSLVAIQNEVAAKLSKENNLERFIWIDPDMNDAGNHSDYDSRQPDFIELLRSTEELQCGADIFETSISELRQSVIDKLKVIEEKKNTPIVANDDATTDEFAEDIYIICDKADRISKAVLPLKNYLFDQGFDVILPVFKGEEDALREDHIENLKSCNSVIIFHGEGDELWMRSKDRELKKVMGYGRSKPFNMKAVYLHDPDEYGEKEDYRSQDLMIINGLGGKKPEDTMKDFMQKLKAQ